MGSIVLEIYLKDVSHSLALQNAVYQGGFYQVSSSTACVFAEHSWPRSHSVRPVKAVGELMFILLEFKTWIYCRLRLKPHDGLRVHMHSHIMKPSVAACNSPYIEIGGRCLMVDSVTKGTWADMRGICQLLNGDLVKIDSLEIMSAIVEYIKNSGLYWYFRVRIWCPDES